MSWKGHREHFLGGLHQPWRLLRRGICWQQRFWFFLFSLFRLVQVFGSWESLFIRLWFHWRQFLLSLFSASLLFGKSGIVFLPASLFFFR